MPIFEFVCKDCNQKFEKMTLSAKEESFSCPSCSSSNVEKQFSTFSAHGSSSSGFSMPPGGGCPGAMGGGCPSGGCMPH